MLRGRRRSYLVELVSHRVLRYGERPPAPRSCSRSSVALARRGRRLPGRPRGAARRARARGRRPHAGSGPGAALRLLLRPRDLGDRRRARPLPPLRRAGGLGQGRRHAVSRALDVAGSTARCLLLASPVLGVAAIAIRLEDGGPVLYRQRRVGLDGREFELLKLRTMVVGAESMGAGFAVNDGDARITRTGRVLRRLSVDELPQLWNVFRGEMSSRRAAPDARLPGRPVHAAAAAPARGQAGYHRAGRRSTGGRRSPGRTGSSSTSGTSSTGRSGST